MKYFVVFLSVLLFSFIRGIIPVLEESAPVTSDSAFLSTRGSEHSLFSWRLSSNGETQISLEFPTEEVYHSFIAFMKGLDPMEALPPSFLEIANHQIPFIKLPVNEWQVPNLDTATLHQFQMVCEIQAEIQGTTQALGPVSFLFLFVRRREESARWNTCIFRHTNAELIHLIHQVMEDASLHPDQLLAPLKADLEKDFPDMFPVGVSFQVTKSSGILRPKVILMKLRDLEAITVAADSFLVFSFYIVLLSPIGAPFRRFLLFVTTKLLHGLEKIYSAFDDMTGGRLTKIITWSLGKISKVLEHSLAVVSFLLSPIIFMVRKVWSKLPFSKRYPNLLGSEEEKFEPLFEEDVSDHVPLLVPENSPPLNSHLSLFPKSDL